MKLEFSQQIVEKISNIKFNQNPSSGSGWTEGHDKVNSRFSNFANVPKEEYYKIAYCDAIKFIKKAGWE
jgi:hypothetical protein